MKSATEGIVKFYYTHRTHWRSYRKWELWINQGWRQAELIAVSGFSFLFEYYMPNGKQYLYMVDIGYDGYFGFIGNSVNRKKPASKWKAAEWFVDNPAEYGIFTDGEL